MAKHELGQLLLTASAAQRLKDFEMLNVTLIEILRFHLDKVTVGLITRRTHDWDSPHALLQVTVGGKKFKIPVPELKRQAPEIAKKIGERMTTNNTSTVRDEIGDLAKAIRLREERIEELENQKRLMAEKGLGSANIDWEIKKVQAKANVYETLRRVAVAMRTGGLVPLRTVGQIVVRGGTRYGSGSAQGRLALDVEVGKQVGYIFADTRGWQEYGDIEHTLLDAEIIFWLACQMPHIPFENEYLVIAHIKGKVIDLETALRTGKIRIARSADED